MDSYIICDEWHKEKSLDQGAKQQHSCQKWGIRYIKLHERECMEFWIEEVR